MEGSENLKIKTRQTYYCHYLRLMKDMPRVSPGNASSYSTTWWTLKKEQPAGGSLGYTGRTSPPASFLFSPHSKKSSLYSFQESLPAGDFLFHSVSSRAKLTKQPCLWSSNTVPIPDRSTRRPGPLFHSLPELLLFSAHYSGW